MESTLGIPGGVTDAVPSGTIVMFHGSTIPTGWAICNGQNGTPDLRDRFIVGAGKSYNPGATGGSDTVTLTTSQMPSHNHSDAASSISLNNGYGSAGYGSSWCVSIGNYKSAGTLMSVPGKVNIGSSGSGEPHENRPPYYALYFIMKL